MLSSEGGGGGGIYGLYSLYITQNNFAFLGPFFAQCTFGLQQVFCTIVLKSLVPQVMYLIDHYMHFKS